MIARVVSLGDPVRASDVVIERPKHRPREITKMHKIAPDVSSPIPCDRKRLCAVFAGSAFSMQVDIEVVKGGIIRVVSPV